MIHLGNILAIMTIILFGILAICLPIAQDKEANYSTLFLILSIIVMLLPVGTGLMYLCK